MRSHSSFPLTADDEHCAVKVPVGFFHFNGAQRHGTASSTLGIGGPRSARHGRSSRRLQVDTGLRACDPEICRRRAGTSDSG